MSPDRPRRRLGQATLISLALYTSIAVVGIGIIVSAGMPALENLRDAQAIDNANDLLSDLQEQIVTVADSGEGSSVDVGVRFSRGELVFDKDADQVYYQTDTDAQLISPHTTKQFGNLRMSALANAEVRKQRIDGEACWMMENEHIAACIRAVPEFIADAIGVDTASFWRFNEGNGQTAADNSSYGNDGTLGSSTGSDASDPTWVSGKRGNALDFDGSDDQVEVADDDTLDEMNRVTVAAWVNFNAYADGSAESLVRKTDSYLFQKTSGNDLCFAVYDGGTLTDWQEACIPSNKLVNDRWMHVAGQFNGSHYRVYLNGTLEDTFDTSATGIDTSTSTVGIGAAPGSFHLDGTLDEVRIWNRSLSTAAIERQYRSDGMLKYIDTRHLLLYYHNKDTGKNLSAQYMIELDTQFEGSFTKNGTGYTEPALTGDNLGRGRVDAQVRTFFGTDYTIAFKLLSGSDFVQVDVLTS